MVYRSPAPAPSTASPTVIPERVRRQLIDLAILARRSDAEGLPHISREANRIILEHRLTPEQIMAAIHFLEARVKLLTGYVQKPPGSRDYTADEVADLMKRYPRFIVECMKSYPGKRNAIDLDKVVTALNKGKLRAPELW